MKKTILTTALIFCGLAAGMSQAPVSTPKMPYDSVKKSIIYTEVVQVPGADKGKLYDRAMLTLPTVFKEAEKKMTVKDRDAGKIEMKCTTRVSLIDPKTKLMTASPDLILYNLSMMFKDGKYKYEFSNFHLDRASHPYALEHYYLKDDPNVSYKNDRTDEKLKYLVDELTGNIRKLKSGLASDKVETKSDW